MRPSRKPHRAMAVVLTLALTLTACGGPAAVPDDGSSAEPTEQDDATEPGGSDEPTAEPTAQDVPTAPAEPTEPGETAEDNNGGYGEAEIQAAAERYGYGPSPDPAITLQPDVVLVGGGPAAIRAASDDGFTWTMDPDAAGIRDLAIGDVMFASAMAVGRVIGIDGHPDGVEVTLIPVEITEIIRDGELTIDQPLDLDGFQLQEIPGYPDGGVFPDPLPDPVDDLPEAPEPDIPEASPTAAARGDLTSPPHVQLVAASSAGEAPAPPNKLPEPNPAVALPEFNMEGFTVAPYFSARQVGFKVSRTVDGLKLSGNVWVSFKDPSLTGRVAVSNGEVDEFEYMVEGIEGFSVDFDGGAENGLLDNQNLLFEIPMNIGDIPVPILGVPTVVRLELKFILATAFTANNSTLSFTGDWAIDGGLGHDAAGSLPASAAEGTSVTATTEGVSVGVTGFIFAASFRALWGIGVPLAAAGPWAKLVVSVGITRGSDLAAPLAGGIQCRHARVELKGEAGIGVASSPAVESVVNRLLDVAKAALELAGLEVENFKVATEKKLIEQSLLGPYDLFEPNVPLCQF